MKNLQITIFLVLISTLSLFSQSDSLRFKTIQKELEGCWKTKHYQFKYDAEKNWGHECKSKVHSSAPFFKLIIKENKVFLEWIEVLGGSHFLEVISVKKNKLKVKNENGYSYSYRRNKKLSKNK